MKHKIALEDKIKFLKKYNNVIPKLPAKEFVKLARKELKYSSKTVACDIIAGLRNIKKYV